MPPSTSSHTIKSSEQNKCRPRIVAATSICSTCIPERMISNDNQRASAKAVCDVWLISTADSKTEGLYVLLMRKETLPLNSSDTKTSSAKNCSRSIWSKKYDSCQKEPLKQWSKQSANDTINSYCSMTVEVDMQHTAKTAPSQQQFDFSACYTNWSILYHSAWQKYFKIYFMCRTYIGLLYKLMIARIYTFLWSGFYPSILASMHVVCVLFWL